jgi:hypothetical protein
VDLQGNGHHHSGGVLLLLSFHEGSTAVTWQFRDSVLVITPVGKYSFEEKIQAVTDALGSPQFHASTLLLIDSRSRSVLRVAQRTIRKTFLSPHLPAASIDRFRLTSP